MRAEQLLRLYPRAWRARYADEFLATVGDERLSLRQVIDITAGAIDAWFSPEVRRATRVPRTEAALGGNLMFKKLMTSCGSTNVEVSRRDALIGALVLIGAAFLCSTLSIVAKRQGFEWMSETLMAIAFPGSVLLSMPFTYLKGKSWRTHLVFVALPMLLIVMMALCAHFI